MKDLNNIKTFAEVTSATPSPCFSELEFIKFTNLINKQVIFEEIKEFTKKRNFPPFDDITCLIAKIYLSEYKKHFKTFISSTVVIKQLSQYKDKLPFIATIIKNKRYYMLI